MNMTMVVCKVLLNAALVVFNAATAFSGGPQLAEQNSQPRIENAKVETHNVAGTLAATIGAAEKNAAGAMWIGYSVKMVAGQRTICCGDYSDGGDVRCGKCELESGHDHWSNINSKKNDNGSTGKTVVKLEGGEQLTVLFRLQDHHVTRIKLASED